MDDMVESVRRWRRHRECQWAIEADKCDSGVTPSRDKPRVPRRFTFYVKYSLFPRFTSRSVDVPLGAPVKKHVFTSPQYRRPGAVINFWDCSRRPRILSLVLVGLEQWVQLLTFFLMMPYQSCHCHSRSLYSAFSWPCLSPIQGAHGRGSRCLLNPGASQSSEICSSDMTEGGYVRESARNVLVSTER